MDGAGLSRRLSRTIPPPPTYVWEPLKFPSYGLGSIKAQEVNKMLGKGVLKLVENPGATVGHS